MTKPGTSNILILDPSTTGHHREYLRHLAEACGKQTDGKRPFRFFVDASLVEELSVNGVPVEGLPEGLDEGAAQLEYVFDKAGGDAAELFLPRFNTYLVALLEGGSSRLKAQLQKASVSGIWFGPQSASIVYGGPLSAKTRGLLEILRMRRLGKQSGLKRLYLLNDPKTASALNQWVKLRRGIHSLADPVIPIKKPIEPASEIRRRHGVRSGVTVFSLLGALREGKGVEHTLKALSSWKPRPGKRVVLLLAGEPLPAFKSQLEAALEKWRTAAPQVELVTDLRFLQPEEFAAYLKISDYLLLPYENVYNSSGLLGHAALTNTPVIATRKGLLGHLVEGFELGATVDSASESAFHKVLNQATQGSVTLNSVKAAVYCEENSISAFQKTLTQGFHES